MGVVINEEHIQKKAALHLLFEEHLGHGEVDTLFKVLDKKNHTKIGLTQKNFYEQIKFILQRFSFKDSQKKKTYHQYIECYYKNNKY